MLGSQTEEQDISAEDIVLDLNPCPCPGSQQSPIISPLDVKGHGAWHLGPVTLLVASKMRRTSLRVTPGSCWPGLLHIITFIIIIIIIIIRTMYVTQRHNVSTYHKYKCWQSVWQWPPSCTLERVHRASRRDANPLPFIAVSSYWGLFWYGNGNQLFFTLHYYCNKIVLL